MAENPQRSGHARPLSPHLTIWRWQVTMLSSIMHRATGMALSAGAIVLAWWLVCVSNGPEGYDGFMLYAATPLGLLVLFGFTWSFAYHFCNGIRHLAWDAGYGFELPSVHASGWAVVIAACVLTVLAWVIGLVAG